MRIYILTLIIIIFSSCNNYKVESERLKYENDSIKNILKEVSNKYVFDSVSFREIYSKKNTRKLNSEFEVEFQFVGYNNKHSFVKKYNKDKDIYDEYLPLDNGGAQFKTILKQKVTRLSWEIEVKSKYGKSKKNNAADMFIID